MKRQADRLCVRPSVWYNFWVFFISKGLNVTHSLSSIFHPSHIADWSFNGILSVTNRMLQFTLISRHLQICGRKKIIFTESSWDAIYFTDRGYSRYEIGWNALITRDLFQIHFSLKIGKKNYAWKMNVFSVMHGVLNLNPDKDARLQCYFKHSPVHFRFAVGILLNMRKEPVLGLIVWCASL